MNKNLQKQPTKKYTAYADDIFNLYDTSYRRKVGEYDSYEEAEAACRKIIDDFIKMYGSNKKELALAHAHHGESPFVVPDGPNGESFSATSYYDEVFDKHFKSSKNDKEKEEKELYIALDIDWKTGIFYTYLINPTDIDYSHVLFNSDGYGSFDDELIQTDSKEKDLGKLSRNSFVVIEQSHLYELGEFNISYHLTLVEENSNQALGLTFGLDKRCHHGWSKENEEYIDEANKSLIKID
jgi:hypothetical protein